VFLAALFCEVKGLDPAWKYFLVRFIQRFGIAEPVDLSVKVLAKQFGLSDRQVTASLEALVACKVMDFSSASEGRGRPKRCYRLQEDFHKKLNKAAEPPPTHHEVAVGNLLKHENRKAAQASEKPETRKLDVAALADLRSKRQPGQLSVVNRLLLSVLLCHANRFGVVRGLGSSTLCKVTGLSKEGLKHRVQRLIDQGLIRAYVPGATSTLLSTKMKSTYFLNLNHPELSVDGNATSVLICAMADHPSESVPNAHQIYSDIVKLKLDPTALMDGQYKQRLRFFESQSLSFFRLLQVMLEKYAADMLSRHWSDLGHSASNKWAHVQEWRELIRKDFRFPKQLPSVDGDHLKKIDEDQHVALIDDLHYRVYVLATRIKKLLCRASEVSFDTMDFVIMPQVMMHGYCDITLLARPRDSDGWCGCLFVQPDTEPQGFSCESDIPIEFRYRYGLLTRPGREGMAT
jgi:hypothetical protein